MQTFLVALLIGVLSVYIVSGNSLKQWNTEGMVFPCGESRGKVEGSKVGVVHAFVSERLIRLPIELERDDLQLPWQLG